VRGREAFVSFDFRLKPAGEPRAMRNAFQENAAKLQELKQNIDDSCARRDESPHERAAWEEACRTFHNSYDELAFPGGLAREFELLQQGDVQAIEMAVQFLEADPSYFRSGYHKEDLIKILRKQCLSEEQVARLRRMILERVRRLSVREMRSYARLAPVVANHEFERALEDIADRSNKTAVRNATGILNYLKSYRGAHCE
jgi:hypothetical protein